jgi:putative SOS response-associated peptidase YedK
MCGRFVSSSPPEQIAAYFGAEVVAPELPISYNVAPTDDIYGIVETAAGRRLEVFHWGLVPVWAKDVKIGQRMINARAETLATNGAFKRAFEKYRCIIPADGFFEWRMEPDHDGGPKRKPDKQPMYIHRLDGEPLAFAGLWSAWRDRAGGEDAPWLHSATIVTTQANSTVAPVHDRMPVILPASAWAAWLDRRNDDVATLGMLLVPAGDDLLTLRAVGRGVNSVRNNGPELITPMDEDPVLNEAGDLPPPTLF